MNLKFLVPENVFSENDVVYINPVYWILKSFYKLHGKFYNKINWLEPLVGKPSSIEDTLEQICQEKVDILCISVFIWNKDFLFKLSRLAKQKLPNLKIIAGGPELSTDDSDFWINHEFIDYTVYGDGETAFLHILDSILSKKELDDTAVNIIVKNKKYPHKVFYDEKFSSISPYLANKEEIKSIVNKIGPEKVYLCWEMSRGCPYSCSFCDWSSGLHTKVKRRNPDWKAELDFFEELNIAAINVNDANWGIFKEDVEIHRYAMTKNFYFRSGNLPKLNKKTAYEILEMNYLRHKQLENFQNLKKASFFYKISLQDTNLDILENISRPEIQWHEHKKIITEFIERNPDIKLEAELIIGLPGQTVDSWIETLSELYSANFRKFKWQFWAMLPKSPANKKEYQQKYKLKTADLIVFGKTKGIKHKTISLDNIIDSVNNCKGGLYRMNTVVETFSCDFNDIITMRALTVMLEIFVKLMPKQKLNIKKFLNSIKLYVYEDSKIIAEKMLKTKTAIIFDENNNVVSDDLYYRNLLKKIKNSSINIDE